MAQHRPHRRGRSRRSAGAARLGRALPASPRDHAPRRRQPVAPGRPGHRPGAGHRQPGFRGGDEQTPGPARQLGGVPREGNREPDKRPHDHRRGPAGGSRRHRHAGRRTGSAGSRRRRRTSRNRRSARCAPNSCATGSGRSSPDCPTIRGEWYGSGCSTQMSNVEIAPVLGVTPQRVSQLWKAGWGTMWSTLSRRPRTVARRRMRGGPVTTTIRKCSELSLSSIWTTCQVPVRSRLPWRG